MSSATGVTARFSTDKGPVVCRAVYRSGGVAECLTDMAKHLESEGVFPVKLLRVYVQDVPLIGGEAAWTLAGPMQRIPESQFVCHQEMLT